MQSLQKHTNTDVQQKLDIHIKLFIQRLNFA